MSFLKNPVLHSSNQNRSRSTKQILRNRNRTQKITQAQITK